MTQFEREFACNTSYAGTEAVTPSSFSSSSLPFSHHPPLLHLSCCCCCLSLNRCWSHCCLNLERVEISYRETKEPFSPDDESSFFAFLASSLGASVFLFITVVLLSRCTYLQNSFEQASCNKLTFWCQCSHRSNVPLPGTSDIGNLLHWPQPEQRIQLITLFRISFHHLFPVILVQRRESSHPPLNTRSRSNACHSTDLFSSPVSETLHFSHTADKPHCSSDNVFKTSCLNLNRQQTPSADHTVQSDEVGR